MKRFLMLSFLLSLLTVLLASCSAQAPHGDGVPKPPQDSVTVPPDDTEIYKPHSEDYGRDTVALSALEYVRPDADRLIGRCEEVATLAEGEVGLDELTDRVREILSEYNSFRSMHTLSEIRYFADVKSISHAVEFEINKSRVGEIEAALEAAFTALAGSEHRVALEESVLGRGFLEGRIKGTAELEALLATEAELETRYVSAVESERRGLFVELVKTRRLIAEAAGYTSYTDYLYATEGVGYTPDDASRLIRNVANYTMPVYVSLASSVFYSYFGGKSPSSVGTATVINRLYDVLRERDSDLADVYAYMLHYGLYEIGSRKEGQSGVSFVSYIPDTSSPVLYMTAVGNITDYTSAARLFGKYFDAYVNYGADGDPSLYVAEDALPLLTLVGLNGRISDADYRYLYYSGMYELLSELVMQAYRARFEMSVYRLAYSKITVETIDELAIEAADALYLTPDSVTQPEVAITDELVLSPYSTVSDCVAKLLSLEIYFTELSEAGAGFEAFKDVVSRGIPRSFDEQLWHAEIGSPFEAGTLKEISDKVHYYIMGYHYFEEFAE